jgi:Dyp-type peroxidase family
LTAYVTGRKEREKRLLGTIGESRKQAGIEFPTAGEQPHVLIIRMNLSREVKAGSDMPGPDIVRNGLRRLCGFFERIKNGEKRFNEFGKDGMFHYKHLVNDYAFSATVGFGIGFFDRLNISRDKRPRHLREMPDHSGLGDPSPYNLAQTDLLIQIGCKEDHINRWVLENTVQAPQLLNEYTGVDIKKNCPEGVVIKPNQRCCPDGQIIDKEEKCTPDIISALEGWATIVDVNSGFQRLDGRNLMGFNDGVSNPAPNSGAAFDDVVWTTREDEGDNLKDGTYAVYQKIEHDLDQWRQLSLEQQEKWVGRKKSTGLLIGTLSDEEDRKLGQNLQSTDNRIREEATRQLKEHIKPQRDPKTRFYDDNRFKNAVPAWSHVRKANPREELVDLYKGSTNGRIRKHLIFRRGFLFVETDENDDVRSGLHFICFQRNIDKGFEFIKKNWLNNKDFPAPDSGSNLKRTFTEQELVRRRQHGRLTGEELFRINNDPGKRKLLGLETDKEFSQALRNAGVDPSKYPPQPTKDLTTGNPIIADTQNTGREGLAGPSELGVYPSGQFLAIVPMGGGYYFVPPIPNKRMKYIGQQFFDKWLDA